MARAYRYAAGDGPEPEELEILRLMDQFGAVAIVGRVLGVGETRRMLTVEKIVQAYLQRGAAENWVSWAQEHPKLNALLLHATRAADAG